MKRRDFLKGLGSCSLGMLLAPQLIQSLLKDSFSIPFAGSQSGVFADLFLRGIYFRSIENGCVSLSEINCGAEDWSLPLGQKFLLETNETGGYCATPIARDPVKKSACTEVVQTDLDGRIDLPNQFLHSLQKDESDEVVIYGMLDHLIIVSLRTHDGWRRQDEENFPAGIAALTKLGL